MREFNKIWGIGLPRSAGQTLQLALRILTGRRVWHSIGRRFDLIDEGDLGAVETWVPVPYLEEKFPGSLYIFNTRSEEPWIKSCEKVYGISQGFNHPIWQHPIDSFLYYRDEYLYPRMYQSCCETLIHDFTELPTWDYLCDFLEIEVPDIPFPNADKFRTGDSVLTTIPGVTDEIDLDFGLGVM